MFPRTLRARIVVSIAGFMAASLAMGFLWVHYGLRVVLQSESDSLLERTAAEIAALSRDTSEHGWTALAEELDREVEAHETTGLTAVIRREGETLIFPSRPATRDLATVLAERPPSIAPTTVILPSGAQYRFVDVP
ncbi:MAG TPA: hypothetical protein VHB77_17405, partial [Planctomycetaceae bacterium]|nr:hypothetical protein [Planctomycetaceae bacterium]